MIDGMLDCKVVLAADCTSEGQISSYVEGLGTLRGLAGSWGRLDKERLDKRAVKESRGKVLGKK